MKEYELIQLLKEMSLEEKVNQMLQVTGGFFTGEIAAMGPMKENGFTDENIYLAGSVIGTFGASQVKKIQKEFMRKHPHHIPLLFMLDVINGLKPFFRFRWVKALLLNRNFPDVVQKLQLRKRQSAAFMLLSLQ